MLSSVITLSAVQPTPSDFADVTGGSDSVSSFGQGNGIGACPSMTDSAEVHVDSLRKMPLEDGTFEAVQSHLVKDSSLDNMQTHMAIDLAQLERQAAKWQAIFPRVHAFYAVKSLPDPVVVQTLASCGINFDCASKLEIETVRASWVDSSRIIFANPCKFPQDIALARREGVHKMTFDNSDELEKVAQLHPEAELVLRIVTDDSASLCRLSNKYGAAIEDCEMLLQRAHKLALNVIGVSFHVGSGASDPQAFVDALFNARKVFDMAKGAGFPAFRLLDIGGGFPGDDDAGITLAQIATVINPMLQDLFPPEVEVIAEPGRFFSHSSATLACRVISRRVVASRIHEPTKNELQEQEDPDVLYYLSDGVYGSFNCMLFDHYTPAMPSHVRVKPSGSKLAKAKSRVFGPTCDGLDTIFDSIELPLMDVGDWLVFRNMGAYTIAAASRFNGIERPKLSYVRTD